MRMFSSQDYLCIRHGPGELGKPCNLGEGEEEAPRFRARESGRGQTSPSVTGLQATGCLSDAKIPAPPATALQSSPSPPSLPRAALFHASSPRGSQESADLLPASPPAQPGVRRGASSTPPTASGTRLLHRGCNTTLKNSASIAPL